MPYDGNGNYTPPSPPTFPAVNGEVIRSDYFNATINDIATALSYIGTLPSQAEAEAGTDNAARMTALRTKQAITFQTAFTQAGSGAVSRTLSSKLRDVVALEDFYDGDFADALEEASAIASVVQVFGTSYSCDRIVEIADGTDVVLNGTTISAAVGISTTHLFTFLGDGAVLGFGEFVGDELDPPVATWAGSGVPQGCCIYAAGASNVSRSGIVRIDGKIVFSGFPSGALFTKWLKRLEIKAIELSNCQTATLQYKPSGSYVNVPTTNVPGDELITSAGVEAYQCDVAHIHDSIIPAISKGVSIYADDAYLSGNTYFYGTSRHVMEHITDCKRVITLGNTYNGAADKGDGSKLVDCDSGVSLGHTYIDNTYCCYVQDSDNLSLGPDSATGVTASAYAFATSSLGRAIENTSLQIGALNGAGLADSRVIYVATDAGAVTAGYLIDLDISGGRVSGFEGLIDHATAGLGGIFDLNWKGTVVRGTAEAMDLRVRNAEVDLTFIGCTAPLVDAGNVAGVGGGSLIVRTTARECSGSYHQRFAAGAAYAGTFDYAELSIKSSNSTIDRALSFALGASDSLGLFNLDINCPDLDPDSTGSGGQAIVFDANSKTFKARLRISALGLGSYTPMNVTLTNAGSVTGVYEKPIAGTLTGGALTIV